MKLHIKLLFLLAAVLSCALVEAKVNIHPPEAGALDDTYARPVAVGQELLSRIRESGHFELVSPSKAAVQLNLVFKKNERDAKVEMIRLRFQAPDASPRYMTLYYSPGSLKTQGGRERIEARAAEMIFDRVTAHLKLSEGEGLHADHGLNQVYLDLTPRSPELSPAPEITDPVKPPLSEPELMREIRALTERLTPKFLILMIPDRHKAEAYSLAQIEDYEYLETPLITDEMAELMHPFPLVAENDGDTWNALSVWTDVNRLSKQVSELPKEQSLPVVEYWRGTFLSKMAESLALRDAVLPTTIWNLGLLASYDSNVNRVTDHTKIVPSGKSDWVSSLMLTHNWTPWVNNKKLNSRWRFRLQSNLVHITQNAHKENESSFAGIQPDLSRIFIGSPFESLGLSMPFNHLLTSRSAESRRLESKYFSRSLRLYLPFRPYRMGSYQFQVSPVLESGKRDYFGPTSSMESADFDQAELSLRFGGKVTQITLGFIYEEYNAGEPVSSYDRERVDLKLQQLYKPRWKQSPFQFTEGLLYQERKYGDGALERLRGAMFRFTTKVASHVNSYGSFQFNRISTGSKDEQMITTLGLIWVW